MSHMKALLEDIAIDISTEYPHHDTAFAIYLNNHHIPLTEDWRDEFEAFQESYVGQFDSRTDFANDYIEQTGLLEPSQYGNNPRVELLIRYFDVDSFGRDLMHDYWETDGHYFRDQY